MALNENQLNILAAELQNDPENAGYASLLDDQEYTAIAALLNDRAQIPNPDPQLQVAAGITWDEFLVILKEQNPSEILTLYSHGQLAADLRVALEADNRPLLFAIWAGLATALQSATVTAVATAFNEKEPDPDWPETVPGDSRAMTLALPRVTGADVQRVDVSGIGA